ncbi:Gfo/Idh/MocA family oxidoreductase [Candidatus Pelagibacter sp.]|nr:Gfo/Idh/MocA family oxidoreductase [Candidatus Pelagibacter sp.]|tara:strand:- start:842 stop:1822 length:981 start_codon:yes stop_codon:yes gene_type:complete
MKIIAAVIGMGIGEKHLTAIDGFLGSKVKIICEKNKKKIKILKKKYPDKIVTSDENNIFLDKQINLVSLASYDNHHYNQILKCFKFNKNFIVEKPMCLNFNQLKNIYKLVRVKKIKMTSNLVLRVNSLFRNFKKNLNNKKIYYIEGDYLWGRKKKLFGWRSKIKEYSLTLGAGIHIIDLINWLTNLKPKTVYAVGNKKATKKTVFKKNSLITMLFEYPKNILVKITANGAAVFDHFHEIKIFSDNQTLVNSRLGSYIVEKDSLKKINSKYPDKKNRKKLIHNFIETLIKKNIKPLISIKEQIDLMTICFAVDKSVKLNKKIKIKYL